MHLTTWKEKRMTPCPRMGLGCSQTGSGRREINLRAPSVSGDAHVYAHVHTWIGDVVFLRC